MSLRVHRVDASGLMTCAGPFLLEREDAHSLLLGLVGSALQYLAIVTRDDEVLGVALASPRGLVLSHVQGPGVVDAVAEDLSSLGVALHAVVGPPAASRRFAERWTARHGGSARRWAMRVHRADTVTLPVLPHGALRSVTGADRALLARWCAGFAADANLPDAGDPAVQADALIAQAHATWIWTDGGQAAAMAHYGSPTPHSVRVSGVYTPPELRGRGYASACVAALTRKLLDDGWAFVTLFTDLTNPTSNRIYARIGYQPVCDMDHYRLMRP